ncbi:hypothetical protein APHNP_0025 [Anaplasma phagocytophilum str. ApNP]|uniref:Uncharacterized protein n=2 Tax=Anaplasma phagocytophilum TaxID=948 RepID=A0A0F3NJS6_ANAPH|nr:hypothetical protein APHMUC_0267 [Anaplasma phagocytophilum str. ApMUC09]KJV67139.1 hypothetical protein APHNP_0025 [Anaplasma phagocytophilum str. ApNP]
MLTRCTELCYYGGDYESNIGDALALFVPALAEMRYLLSHHVGITGYYSTNPRSMNKSL